jgi:hypothetical protein
MTKSQHLFAVVHMPLLPASRSRSWREGLRGPEESATEAGLPLWTMGKGGGLMPAGMGWLWKGRTRQRVGDTLVALETWLLGFAEVDECGAEKTSSHLPALLLRCCTPGMGPFTTRNSRNKGRSQETPASVSIAFSPFTHGMNVGADTPVLIRGLAILLLS